MPVNPNAEIFASNNTWEWTGKVSGAYTFPLAIIASANYEHPERDAAGSASALHGEARRFGDLVNVEPVGTIVYPTPTWWTCVRPSDLPSEGRKPWSCAWMSSMR